VLTKELVDVTLDYTRLSRSEFTHDQNFVQALTLTLENKQSQQLASSFGFRILLLRPACLQFETGPRRGLLIPRKFVQFPKLRSSAT